MLELITKKSYVEGGLKNVIQKLQENWNLGVRRERGRKRISNEIVEEVAFAVVERESCFQYFAPSTREV